MQLTPPPQHIKGPRPSLVPRPPWIVRAVLLSKLSKKETWVAQNPMWWERGEREGARCVRNDIFSGPNQSMDLYRIGPFSGIPYRATHLPASWKSSPGGASDGRRFARLVILADENGLIVSQFAALPLSA